MKFYCFIFTFFLIPYGVSNVSKFGGAKIEKGKIETQARFGYSKDKDNNSDDRRYKM